MKMKPCIIAIIIILMILLTACFGGAASPLDNPEEVAPIFSEPIEEAEKKPEPAPEPDLVPQSKLPPEDSTFEIYFLDVGQGDASVILCDGDAMLIDGGIPSNSSMIYSFLQSHSINYLDYIVATHPDADHIGGLSGALNYAKVGTAYCTIGTHDSEAFSDFVSYLEKQDVSITVPEAGDYFDLGSAKVTILHPEHGISYSDNTSIVLRIEYGETTFLFTGDAEIEDEEALLFKDAQLYSTVLKVGHHGSSSSTTEPFLNAVCPSYAVISVGGNNSYGHPTQEVLSRLQAAGAQVLRTDMHGNIHCTSNGKEVTFDVEKNRSIDSFIAAGGYANMLADAANNSTEQEIHSDDEQPPDTDGSVGDYVVNTNTGKFHYPSCSSADQIKPTNRWDYNGIRDELISMGYQPCKRCNP